MVKLNSKFFEAIETAPNEIVIKKTKDAVLLATASGVMVVYSDNIGDYFTRYPDGSVNCSNPTKCPKEIMDAATKFLNQKLSNDNKYVKVGSSFYQMDRNISSIEKNLIEKYVDNAEQIKEIVSLASEIRVGINTLKEYEDKEKPKDDANLNKKNTTPAKDTVPAKNITPAKDAIKKKTNSDKDEDELEEKSLIQHAKNIFDHYKNNVSKIDMKALEAYKNDLRSFLIKERYSLASIDKFINRICLRQSKIVKILPRINEGYSIISDKNKMPDAISEYIKKNKNGYVALMVSDMNYAVAQNDYDNIVIDNDTVVIEKDKNIVFSIKINDIKDVTVLEPVGNNIIIAGDDFQVIAYGN